MNEEIVIGQDLVGRYFTSTLEVSRGKWFSHIQGVVADGNAILVKCLNIVIDGSACKITHIPDVRYVTLKINHWDEISKKQFDDKYYEALRILLDNHLSGDDLIKISMVDIKKFGD